MNSERELTKEQFTEFLDEFQDDLQNAVRDIARDMENALSFLKNENERNYAVQSVLMGMLTAELSVFLGVYEPKEREEMLADLTENILSMAETVYCDLKKSDE